MIVTLSLVFLLQFPTASELFEKYDSNQDQLLKYTEHKKVFTKHKQYIKKCTGLDALQSKKAYFYVAKFGHVPRNENEWIYMLFKLKMKKVVSSFNDIQKLVDIFTECDEINLNDS